MHVTGVDEDTTGDVEVGLLLSQREMSRYRDERPIAKAVVGSDGSANFDLGAFDLEFWALSAEVDHTQYLPGVARVGPSDESGSELSAHVALTRACVLVGAVQDPRGVPISDAVVAWLPEQLGIVVEHDVANLGGGRFRYRATRGERVRLVASADGFRTSSVLITVPHAHEFQVPPIVLDRGATIRGRVTGGGAGHGRATVVSATWYGGGESLNPRRSSWGSVYAGERFVRDRVSARVDAEGDYELVGLEPGPWRLRVVDVAGEVESPPQPTVARELLDTADRVVSAPRDGVDFDVSRATLRVRVRDADGPIAGTSVAFGGAEGTIVWTDDDGVARLVFPALRATEVRSPADGVAAVRRSVRTGIDGTETLVEMTCSRADPAEPFLSGPNVTHCTVRAVGPDDREVPARCRVYAAGGTRQAVRFEGRRGSATYSSTDRLLPGGPSSVVLPMGAPLVLEFDAEGYAIRRVPLEMDPDEPRVENLRIVLSAR